jgi:phosphatidylserine decarboxylase
MSYATYAAAQLLRVLPRVRITRAVGRLADARIPAPLSRAVVGIYARAYAVDMDEAACPNGAWESFDAFFTRELLPGRRPAPTDDRAIVSPADGRFDAAGNVDKGGKFVVKGRDYTAQDLLGDPQEAARYEEGQYFIVYLSPRDYHRVHAPVAGRITQIRSMAGDLFPVNRIGENHVPSLLAINRRVAIPIDSVHHGRVTVVMVGAMIVGRITVTCIAERDVPLGDHAILPPFGVERGDEIGVFHLGSTAVVFLEKGTPRIDRPRGPVRFGEALHGISPSAPETGSV